MSGSQKFIARNRAPRVQIEYDVELYGAEKKVQLPFVMGVMSDLSGKAEKPAVDQRAFLEIDADNFDDRMQAMAPKAQFSVPNTLTGDGNLSVDLTFERMDDFSPEAIAAKVETLAPLLEARRQLSDLMAYMDGKAGAETLIETLLSQPGLLQALAQPAEAQSDMSEALDSLRAALPDTPEPVDDANDTLAALAAATPQDISDQPSMDDVLATIEAAPDAEQEPDLSSAVLDGLAAAAPADAPSDTTVDDVLGALEAVPETEETDATDDILTGIADAAADTPDSTDVTADVLAGIDRAADPASEDDTTSDVLSNIARVEESPQAEDEMAGVLAGLSSAEPTEEDDADVMSDILSGIERAEDGAPASDDTSDILAALEPAEVAPPTDATDDILADLPEIPLDAPQDDATADILADIPAAAEETGSDETLDDVLAGLDAPDIPEAEEDRSEDILASLEAPTEAPEDEGADEILSGIPAAEPEPELAVDALDDVLAGLEPTAAPDTDDAGALDDILGALDVEPEPAAEEHDALADILAGVEASETAAPGAADSLADILGGLGDAEAEYQGTESTDDILADIDAVDGPPVSEDEAASVLGAVPEVEENATDAGDDLDALLSDLSEPEASEDTSEDDLDSILGDLGTVAPSVAEPETEDGDLDSLLGDLAGDTSETPDVEEVAEAPTDAGSLDDLLADLGADTDIPADEAEQDAPADDLDALLSDLGGDNADGALDTAEETGDLDALLADIGDADTSAELASVPEAPIQSPFGMLSAARPDRSSLHRPTFRMALFGDFTGRAARGLLETGDALASRKAIELDVDTVEDVIEGFATTLRLPIGKDSGGIDVKLGGLDDLHPDELYDNVEIFEALAALRQQLDVGSMAERAIENLKAWSDTYGTPVQIPKRSASTSVPAHLKLSDFQALIGDTGGDLSPASPIDDMIARIVGPHIVKAPDAGIEAMKSAVDAALGSAMRLVLHHPDFQAVEAQWRSLDLLARRIETDSTLQIALYDVSAEELAADLAAQEDLAESGLFRLLTDVLDPEEGTGGFSALFGLYTFEETPPHAELLARIGQVAAHVDAPFFAAMSPAYLETAAEDRHPLVAQTWDTLRTLPEAGYIGLASPRFLLRQPYGAKSDPISPFAFEEFTPQEGLRSLLWANPVVLVAVLVAATHKKDGKAMDLGSLMSLGDLPFHYVTDRHGDQVALPSTERNLTSAPTQLTLARGYMPVVWMKGRNEVRLGSFRSLGGDEISGPWSSEVPAPRLGPGDDTGDEGSGGDATIALDIQIGEDDGESLDDLLADFDDDMGGSDGADTDDMDADLAALLEGL